MPSRSEFYNKIYQDTCETNLINSDYGGFHGHVTL